MRKMARSWVQVGVNSGGDPVFERSYSGDASPLPIVAEDDNGDDPRATSAAVARAAELGVDLDSVTGTGLNGRITVGDVEAAA
jgi:pyruvate/2-oxoglutarate dehydrogenase complex dihydrolipoamide acyltransferase (E2) component